MRYQNLEYEATLDLLKQAMSWSGTVDEELAQIHLLRGLCNLQMGREANGKAAFRAALLADSAVQLPPMTSPKIRQVFQLESESLSRARPPAPPAAPDPRRPADAPLSPVAGSPRATAEPVPALEVAPPVPPAPEKKVGEPVRWPAFATLGAAVLAVGIGAGFGYAAKDSADQSFAARYASDQGRLNQQAKDQAKVANGLYGAAAGLAVLGGVFFFVF
ncbi:MAG TPA: hypothetical protein VGK67_32280 [Myxococcales bacterium]